LIVFALAIASAAAFDLRGSDIYQRELVVPVIEQEGRITNGQNAAPNQFPYQVGLTIQTSMGSSWCGGSLISNEWVLTAAHCTDKASSVSVYLGSNQRTSPAVVRTVSKSAIIIHANWSPTLIRNDISLIKIPAVTFTSAIQKVTLPKMSSSYGTFEGQKVIASGWGKTSDSSSVASYLQYAVMTVISNTQCKGTFGSIIQPGNICVSTPGGTSTCNGDSGGPLVLESNKMLVGITSFGSGQGCTKGYPAAFTRVTSYLDWIKSNSGVSA